ncbi:hypothetical protein VNO77_20988 [Canavalia gladiata]|uniref:Uncharacterized protein n=1 Tax=Canavalia gladiata TaxID=3824 RepID=A0AAN9LR49_CANGL
MKNLSMLSLEGTAISYLPSSLGCLVNLAVLNLKDCKKLVCLPNTIDRLQWGKIMDTSGCSNLNSGVTFLSIPIYVPKLSKQENPAPSNYQELDQPLPINASSTKELDASDCDSLQTTKFNQHTQQYVPKGLGPSPLEKRITASKGASIPRNVDKKVGIALCFLLKSYASRKGFYQT